MRELSMLEEQLLDEYCRCERNLKTQSDEIEKCIKGYISVKKIRGNSYSYLQWKENGTVKSKYIPSKDLEWVSKSIEQRRKWAKSVRRLKRSLKQIERALGKELINEYKSQA